MSIQDRTSEFHTLTSAASRSFVKSNASSAHTRLLHSQSPPPSARPSRGEFARRAADIGRAITATMERLEQLAKLAKGKSLFDDKSAEISKWTFLIKQDLSSINGQISDLQALQRQKSNGRNEEGEHSKNVVVMLQGKLADVSVGFKEVLEVRTKNIQASRHRTDQFISHIRPPPPTDRPHSASPLYSTPSTTPHPPTDLLTLDPLPSTSSAQSLHQLQLLESGESSNSYISARSEAIEAIEKTILELGGIFGQLAQMVGEQSEMIQRIDHETEDVVTNVEGGQRELLKYWGRVSSNRWLVVKMFGVLMIFFLLWVLVS
ncbi:Integral membrane protein SED5 [Rhizina undulata]